MTPGESEAAAVAALAQEADAPAVVEGGKAYVVRGRELLDLEALGERPRRQRGTATFREPAALAAWLGVMVQPAANVEASLWTDWRRGRVTAVLNGGGPGSPGWGDWRAELELTTTPEWKRWTALNRSLVPQTRFAEHVEECAPDFVDSPDAATMLELALSLQVHKDAQFRSSIVLQSGQRQFGYDETIGATAGSAGQLTVPGQFFVAVAPWDGVQKWKLTARLLYRLQDGVLRIGYELAQLDEAQRESFAEVVTTLGASGLAAYAGDPPPPVQAAAPQL